MIRRLILGCCLGALLGCAASRLTVKLPISGGEYVPIQFSRGAALHAENDDLRVVDAVFMVDAASKRALYFAGIIVKDGRPPRSVKVEDVTDDQPVTFVEDDHPRLADKEWKCTSDPFVPDQNTAAWLSQIEDTIRMYRFTVVTADGRTEVLYEAHGYTAVVKTAMRQQLGL
jgi:hypothetical protein